MLGHAIKKKKKKDFEEKLIRKIDTSHHKQLMIGDYLIDDRKFNGASEFKENGYILGVRKYPNWESVLKFLKY